MTLRKRLALAALSGVLTALAFPNASVVALLAVCLVPLAAALSGLRARAGALVAGFYGFVFWVATVPWVAFTVHRFGEVSWALGAVALFLVALLLIPPFALFGAIVAAVDDARGPATRLLLWPAAWVLQEAFRTDYYFWGGFPWAYLCYPLASSPPLMQSAALGGAWLTSALVVAVNVAVFEAVRSRRGVRAAWLGGAVAVIAGAWLAGAVSMQRLDAPRKAARTLRVGVIQPNVGQETRWTAETRDTIWRDLLERTRRLVRERHPALVLWPESAAPYSWSFAPAMREELPALCRELDVAILFSTAWSERPEDDDAPYYNAALLVTKDGPVLPPYLKQHLVPFGEYVPAGKVLRAIKPISRAVPGGFTPGAAATLIPFGGVTLGGAVCYEVVYPSVARDEARGGADLLFTLTNDAWYGSLGAREQHFQAVSFRAVETRLPLVRAAITGISGLVDAHGRVLARIGPDVAGSFAAD
ncbi:MAG TPA: apolipoprotein N-acyltransferase, partial [Thermoanaerobaculia bacterium]|nr:apolipoprotein N-acyltransferase [Thermoanaerobaculia bacterium]